MISSPQSNCIYFVNSRDVYRLNTSTKKRTHVAELPFKPRCTATGLGYFCAGGDDKGYLAAIRIPEQQLPQTGTRHRSCSDSANSAQLSQLLDRGSAYGRNFHPRIRGLGEEIVNSISIHRLRGSDGDTEDDVVAILTNNDKTFRMYSLTRDEEIRVEDFPFQMNHATISPNGRLLVIVGDQEWIYFYRRIDMSPSNKSSPSRQASQFEWERLRLYRLHKPPHADGAAYFTTAWSPNGRLCATASEEGYITVFDVDAVVDGDVDDDPVVAIAPSSRKETTPGSIRTMCFAPEPWDLLIWAEEHGRVCVGDVRQGLLARQVVELDPKADNITKFELTDSSSILESSDLRDFDFDFDLMRRHSRVFGAADSRDAGSAAIDYLASRRLQREAGIPEIDDDTQGLNDEERQILEGFRTTRQRDEALQHGSSQAGQSGAQPHRRSSPRSINYMSPTRSGQHTPVQNSSSGELARMRTEAAHLREYMRDIPSPRRTDRQSSQQPRRRNSALMSPSSDPSAPRPSSSTATTQQDPWRTIEAAMGTIARASAAHTNPPTATEFRGSSRSIANDDPYPGLPPLINPYETAPYRDTPNRSGATTTAITLPSLRDRPGGDIGAGPAAASLEQRARNMEREREREPTIRREAALLSRHESSLIRRGGTREIPALWRRMMMDEVIDNGTWGVGTAGVALSDEGRTL